MSNGDHRSKELTDFFSEFLDHGNLPPFWLKLLFNFAKKQYFDPWRAFSKLSKLLWNMHHCFYYEKSFKMNGNMIYFLWQITCSYFSKKLRFLKYFIFIIWIDLKNFNFFSVYIYDYLVGIMLLDDAWFASLTIEILFQMKFEWCYFK